MRRVLVMCAVAAGLAGCGTRLTVRDISGVPKGTNVQGIPFRVREPYTVRLWARQRDGSYRAVFAQAVDLPNPNRTYALNVSGDIFATRTVEVKLREDGTLESVHVKGEDKTAEVLGAAGKQVTAIADAALTFKTKQDAAEVARLQGETGLAGARADLAAAQLKASLQGTNEELARAQAQTNLEKARQELLTTQQGPASNQAARLTAALESYNAAQAALRALEALGPDATNVERGAAEDALRLARLKANQAHRLAGLAEPFPGVFP